MKTTTYTHEQMLDALCLWEAVLTGLTDADRDWWFGQCEGTAVLRDMVATMSPLCAMACERAVNVYEFDDSYDWEWCPRWLEAVKAICVDTNGFPDVVARDVEEVARSVMGVEA